MFGRKQPAVLIVGAGPAGLLGALRLAEHGIAVEVIDPSPPDEALRRRNTRGAVTLLYPRTLGLLDRHGLARSVLERAHELRTVGVYQQEQRVGELSFERLARTQGLRCSFAAVISIADLEVCMLEALRQRRIDLHFARRLARIEQGSARVRVSLDHLGSDSAGYATAHSEFVVEKSEELDLDFVFAADGHQSVVRQQMDVSLRDLGCAERYEVLDGQARGRLPEEAALLFANGASAVVWPLPDDRWRCIVGPDPEARARLAAGIPWFGAIANELSERQHIDVRYSLVSRFGKGRIWLVGGAAHATSPLGAQSLNVGLAEATRLADVLAGALRGAEPLVALGTYERERSQEWARLLHVPASQRGVAVPPAAGATLGPGVLDLERLTPHLPASGGDLDVLFGQLQSDLAKPRGAPNASSALAEPGQ